MGVFSIIILLAVVGFTLPAAIWDVRVNRLPNWITVPSALLGLLFHTVAGAWQAETLLSGGWNGFLYSLSGLAAGFLPLLLVWLIGAAGAGDVKLMGAVGAWMGPRLTLYTYVVSTVVALIASLFTLSRSRKSRGKKKKAEGRKVDWRRVPYGVPVALAAWMVLLWNLINPVG